MKNSRQAKAFSLIEISIVILIIGILVAGVTQSSRLLTQAKLSSAKTLTQSSPVSSIRGLSLWLETTSDASISVTANLLATRDIDDGATITNWLDINPQATLKSDAAATGSPIYRTNVINGLPAVCFNSITNCGATASGNFFSSANFTNITTAATVFAVVRLPNTLAAQPILSKRPVASAATVAGNFQLGTDASGNWVFCDGATSSVSSNVECNYSSSATTAGASRTPYVVSVVYNASLAANTSPQNTLGGINFFQNGAASGQISTASNSPATTASPLLIGRTSTSETAAHFTGYIGELIIYDRSLSREERQSIEAYLGKKWGITVATASY